MEEKQIKIAINGVAGRMGRAIVRVAEECTDLIITHVYERTDSPDIDKRLCEITRSQSQVTVEPSSTISKGHFDVLIDFSTPSSVIDAAQCCLQTKSPMVIGVTGFNDNQKEELQMVAKEIPMLISPNMSIGVNLCFQLLEQITRTSWGKNADAHIVETHHKSKKDKPSGTALKMGEILAMEKGVNLSSIPIESYREGEVMGEHRVFFNIEYERIEIRHEAINRSPFAQGALHAARWLAGTPKKPGVYTMRNVITL